MMDRKSFSAWLAGSAWALAIILGILVLVAGCATTVAPAPTVSRDLISPSRSLTAASSQADIGDEFVQVLAGCQQVLTGFEQQAREARQMSFKLHATGAACGGLAGALATVLPPVGLSLLATCAGVANTLPALVERDGLGASTVLASREDVRANMQLGARKYFSARAEGDKAAAVAALSEMRAACVAYAVTSPSVVIAP